VLRGSPVTEIACATGVAVGVGVDVGAGVGVAVLDGDGNGVGEATSWLRFRGVGVGSMVAFGVAPRSSFLDSRLRQADSRIRISRMLKTRRII
jgi:hypothetical protein